MRLVVVDGDQAAARVPRARREGIAQPDHDQVAHVGRRPGAVSLPPSPSRTVRPARARLPCRRTRASHSDARGRAAVHGPLVSRRRPATRSRRAPPRSGRPPGTSSRCCRSRRDQAALRVVVVVHDAVGPRGVGLALAALVRLESTVRSAMRQSATAFGPPHAVAPHRARTAMTSAQDFVPMLINYQGHLPRRYCTLVL